MPRLHFLREPPGIDHPRAGSCLSDLDVERDERLARQGLQIPEVLATSTAPPAAFSPFFSLSRHGHVPCCLHKRRQA